MNICKTLERFILMMNQSNHFSMGAINKETLKYEYPKIASKENKYKCPSCDKDVIFRKGKIKQSHYAHN